MSTVKDDKGPRLACPSCGGTLKEVFARANYGRVLLLDQCLGCGGLWFDRWELYLLESSSAKELDSVDLKSLKAENLHSEGSPGPLPSGSGKCPRCSSPLVVFKDQGLPPDASIKRCQSCAGLWLNRGEASRYALHRQGMSSRAAASVGPDIDMETLKRLQKGLDLSRISVKGADARALDGTEPPLDAKELMTDLGFLAVQTLLRLLFKI